MASPTLTPPAERIQRFSPYRIGVQMAVLACALVFVTAIILTQKTLGLSYTAIVNHEKTDLRDETNLVALELRDDYARLRETAAAAARRLTGGLSDWESVVTLLRARPEIADVDFVSAGEGPAIVRDGVRLEAPQVGQRWSETSDDGLVWIGRARVDLPNGGPAGAAGTLVLTGRIEALTSRSRSPRHLTFVFGPDGQPFSVPRPHGEVRPVPVPVQTLVDRLRRRFAEADQQTAGLTRDAARTELRDLRTGEWLAEETVLPGYQYYFASTVGIVTDGGQPANRKNLTRRLKPVEQAHPQAIISPQRGDVPRIYLRAWSQQELARLRAAVTHALTGYRLRWETEVVPCETFLVSVTRAFYDPASAQTGQEVGYVDLAVAASVEEMRVGCRQPVHRGEAVDDRVDAAGGAPVAAGGQRHHDAARPYRQQYAAAGARRSGTRPADDAP